MSAPQASEQEDVTEVIYNRIAMLRAKRGISRRELADALGVHYQTVATWSAASTARACTSRCGSPPTSRSRPR
jgi:ribosome-binding protein aMBF1 (putative translation factor)